jgi:hypothetical protein
MEEIKRKRERESMQLGYIELRIMGLALSE